MVVVVVAYIYIGCIEIGEREREREEGGRRSEGERRVEGRVAAHSRLGGRKGRGREAGAATSRAPQCLSVLRMDITSDAADSLLAVWHRRCTYCSRAVEFWRHP